MEYLLYVAFFVTRASSDLVVVNVIGENEDWASSARADAGGNCVLYGYA